MRNDHEEIRLIVLALVGVYAEGVSGSSGRDTFSLSGCRERTIEDFAANADRRIAEGAYAIDKRPSIAKHGARVVFASPLPDVRGEYRAAPDLTPGASFIADALAADTGNGYGALVKGARAGAVCLDSVPLDAYADYWRRHDAKIGRVRAGRIEWEPEAPAPAPEPTQGGLL
jgi:hypothetical protein